MPGLFTWLWDDTNEVWRKALCDANGKLIISDEDPFEITQTTPEDLRHVPHGYDYTNLVYRAIAVDSVGKQLATWTASRIIDADGDTKVDVEESGDEDKIRMDVAGVEAFYLQSAGILTLAKQSAISVWRSAAWTLSHDSITVISFDSESYDVQGEAGTNGRFTATEDGKYTISLQIGTIDADIYQLRARIYKNGSLVISDVNDNRTTNTNTYSRVVKVLSLAANDYIDGYYYQYNYTDGGAITGQVGADATFMTIAKIG